MLRTTHQSLKALLLASVVLLAVGLLAPSTYAAGDKVLICHFPPTTPTMSKSLLSAHPPLLPTKPMGMCC
jgi:hypothetical protein